MPTSPTPRKSSDRELESLQQRFGQPLLLPSNGTTDETNNSPDSLCRLQGESSARSPRASRPETTLIINNDSKSFHQNKELTLEPSCSSPSIVLGSEFFSLESLQDDSPLNWQKVSSSFSDDLRCLGFLSFPHAAFSLARLATDDVAYAVMASLPRLMATLCLLWSVCPTPAYGTSVENVAGFGFGVSTASLLFGLGTGLCSGMDKAGADAVAAEKCHLCWKYLIKCCCVSMWFYIIMAGIVFSIGSLYLPITSIFLNQINVNNPSLLAAAAITFNFAAAGFLGEFFFEIFNRFLSYQRHIRPQLRATIVSSLIHSIVLLLCFFHSQRYVSPFTVGLLHCVMHIVRGASIVLYVYIKRYALGWQSGVRVRLIQRKRPDTSDVRRLDYRRSRRNPTARPGAEPAFPSGVNMSAAESCDSLHPESAAMYAAHQLAKKLDALASIEDEDVLRSISFGVEHQSATSLSPISADPISAGPINDGIVCDSLTTQIILDDSDGSPTHEKTDSFDRISSPVGRLQQRDVRRQRASVPVNERSAVLKRLPSKNSVSPISRTASSSGTASRSIADRGPSVPRSLMHARRLSRRAGGVCQNRRGRQATVVSVRSVTVDKKLLLDGCCLPTTASLTLYWQLQVPRQLKETTEFLKDALPGAVILMIEWISRDIIVLLSAIQGLNALMTAAICIPVLTTVSAYSVGISATTRRNIRVLLRLDNHSSACRVAKVASGLLVTVFALILTILGVTLYCTAPTNVHDFLLPGFLIVAYDFFTIFVNSILWAFDDGIQPFLIECFILSIILPLSVVLGGVYSSDVQTLFIIVAACLLTVLVCAVAELMYRNPMRPGEHQTNKYPSLPDFRLLTWRQCPPDCRPLLSIIHSSLMSWKIQQTPPPSKEEDEDAATAMAAAQEYFEEASPNHSSATENLPWNIQ